MYALLFFVVCNIYGCERTNVVLSQLKQCRSHMLTQRKRRQKNRLICIQLRLLRTRFEIKDTGIENDFDLFFLGGGGEEGRLKTVRTYGKILATPLICLLRGNF